MEELGIDCQVGHPATIRAAEPRRQKHDRRDAELLLRLLVENRFPSIFQSLTDWAVGRLRQIWEQLGTISVPTGPRPASERFRPHGPLEPRGVPVMPERPPVSAVLPAAGASFRSTESSFVAGLLNAQCSSPKVDSSPPQRENFSNTQSSHNGDQYGRANRFF